MTRKIKPKKFPGFSLIISCVFVSVFNFGGCAASTIPPPSKICTEGTQWMSECNNCTCMNGSPACTLKACPSENPCELPIEPGPCFDYKLRFGYNPASGQCEPFPYGGCYINSNNFDTESYCEFLCEGPPICTEGTGWEDECTNKCTCTNIGPICTLKGCLIENPCELPIEPGPCFDYKLRFGYNQESGQCEPFTFGGCFINSNNFETEKDCELRCEEPPPKICSDGSEWKSECNTCSCTDGSPSCTEMYCPPGNPCELPIEPGPCTNYRNRFGYNQESGQCEPFTFGGCYINSNNFETESYCELLCEGPPICTEGTGWRDECDNKCTCTNGDPICTLKDCLIENPCELPIERGPCFDYKLRFGYNPASGQCEPFPYGGCFINSNNFETEFDCELRCEDVCNKPIDTGNCLIGTSYKRFAFNKTSGQCEEFEFFFCPGGNGNKFKEEKDCEDKCEARCEKPPDAGTCYGYFTRYFYNQTSKQCEKFIYGGCGGNGNNYLTEEECESECEKE